jgi:uncharacterized damage-inducible protein DinB
MEQDLRYPVGKFQRGAKPTEEQRCQWIAVMAEAPSRLTAAVEGLTAEQLDTPHRLGGWTVRQTVHHMADSHMNSFVRCKAALSEEEPPVTPFSGAIWAELPDAKSTSVESSVAIFTGLQERWVVQLRSLRPADWDRKFLHPEMGTMTIENLLALYEWHCRHHVAHITSLRERNGWK